MSPPCAQLSAVGRRTLRADILALISTSRPRLSTAIPSLPGALSEPRSSRPPGRPQPDPRRQGLEQGRWMPSRGAAAFGLQRPGQSAAPRHRAWQHPLRPTGRRRDVSTSLLHRRTRLGISHRNELTARNSSQQPAWVALRRRGPSAPSGAHPAPRWQHGAASPQRQRPVLRKSFVATALHLL